MWCKNSHFSTGNLPRIGQRLGLQLGGHSTAAFVVDCFNYSLKDSASAKALQLELDLTDSMWSILWKKKSHNENATNSKKKHAWGAKTIQNRSGKNGPTSNGSWLTTHSQNTTLEVPIFMPIGSPVAAAVDFWVAHHANIESSIGRSSNHPPRDYTWLMTS